MFRKVLSGFLKSQWTNSKGAGLEEVQAQVLNLGVKFKT